MFERLPSTKSALAFAGVSGSLALFGAGCGNTVEGIGNVPLVHCGKGEQPRSNTVDINAVRAGDEIQMGKSIVTDQNGDPATGDFFIKSTGYGRYSIGVNQGNSNNDAVIIPNYDAGQNEVTVVDADEIYTIAGQQGPNDSTSLRITDRCHTEK